MNFIFSFQLHSQVVSLVGYGKKRQHELARYDHSKLLAPWRHGDELDDAVFRMAPLVSRSPHGRNLGYSGEAFRIRFTLRKSATGHPDGRMCWRTEQITPSSSTARVFQR